MDLQSRLESQHAQLHTIINRPSPSLIDASLGEKLSLLSSNFSFPPFFYFTPRPTTIFLSSLSFFLSSFFSFHFAPSSIRSLCTRIKRSAVVYRGGNTRGRKDHRRGEEAHIRRFVKYSLLKFNISKIRYDFSFDVCRKKKSRGEEEEARQEQKYGHGGRGRRWRPGRRWVVFFPFY